jgi:pyridoxamine 5'-phosphate oxidase
MNHLRKDEVDSDPFKQFDAWMKTALDSNQIEPTAMTLATVNENGFPSARIVLLKDYSADGFVFYTNYISRKAMDLAHNQNAALLFWWSALKRQIRIEGTVQKIPEDESDKYFKSRPRGSQIGAWASNQSEVVSDELQLEEQYAQFASRFDGKFVSRPSFWGGYRLSAIRIEFWQGRPDRMHDRLCYEKTRSGKWNIERLSP